MIDSPKTGTEILKAQTMIDNITWTANDIPGPTIEAIKALQKWLEEVYIIKPGDAEYFQNPDYSQCQDD